MIGQVDCSYMTAGQLLALHFFLLFLLISSLTASVSRISSIAANRASNPVQSQVASHTGFRNNLILSCHMSYIMVLDGQHLDKSMYVKSLAGFHTFRIHIPQRVFLDIFISVVAHCSCISESVDCSSFFDHVELVAPTKCRWGPCQSESCSHFTDSIRCWNIHCILAVSY